MSVQVQFRRGTATEHTTFTGAVGEITVDTTDKRAVVHDGTTAGGSPLAKESEIPTLTTLGLATTSTDNAAVRFDGTSGHTQNSGVTISDSNVVAGAKVTSTSSSTSRTLEARFADEINILDYGAVGDNSTDCASALSAALSALPSAGGVIYFPPGKYKFTTEVTYTCPNRMFSLCVRGSGQDSTILTWPNATNGITVTLQNLGNSVHFSDMSITTSSTAGTGFGLSVVNNTITGGFQEGVVHNFSNLTFQGDGGTSADKYWSTALYLQALNFVNIDSVLVYGGNVTSDKKGRGINITDISGIIIGTFNISKSVLALLDIGVLISGNPQGVCISECTIIDSDVGVQTLVGTTSTQSLQVSNSNFANDTANIYIGTPIKDVQLTGNTFISNTTAVASANSVYLADINGFTIVGNEWLSASDVNTVALNIQATNGWPGIITGNTFRGPFDIGIMLGASSSLVTAYPNVFGSTVTTSYSDSGSNNKIRAKVADGGTGLASGTSGGVPYFSSTSAMASSGLLTQYGVVYGGGAGSAPAAASAMSDGQLLVGQTSAAPLPKTISGDISVAASGATAYAGTVPANKGGTGQTSYAVGDILYASTTSALSKLADVATGNALISGGVTTAPSWGKVGLTTHVSGTLPVTNGGTGIATVSQGDLLYASGADTLLALAKSTSASRFLKNSGTSNNPAWARPAFADLSDFTTATAWTPVLKFGGATTGITYSTQAGYYVVIGELTFATFRITLTSKGSATGAALITGYPSPAAYYAGTCPYYAGMSSVTTLGGYLDGNGMNLTNAGATAVSGFSDTNFTNSSDIIIAVLYIHA